MRQRQGQTPSLGPSPPLSALRRQSWKGGSSLAGNQHDVVLIQFQWHLASALGNLPICVHANHCCPSPTGPGPRLPEGPLRTREAMAVCTVSHMTDSVVAAAGGHPLPHTQAHRKAQAAGQVRRHVATASRANQGQGQKGRGTHGVGQARGSLTWCHGHPEALKRLWWRGGSGSTVEAPK